ncbi:S41 family peptidase [Parashewanella spongiae]|uniref:S41 family peptidase n=1 Tax=Parashewanella spongiae TaxID=342950 RepID=A0A3A6T744_9GAMM|nr:S41 family peptidase [Parashewanella spongiae]MCL1079594.1 S41 family peptidase [Parashewanella spongiae]RJY07260.1 S41 family peptidase [Parashewanella spongiae]
MRKILRHFSLLFIGLIIGISISIASRESTNHDPYNFPLMYDVIDSVERFYVEPIARERLVQAAIQGIFTELDSHSKFLTPEQLSDQHTQTAGQYKGFGFEVEPFPNKIQITNVFQSSPAESAGLKIGDQITHINALTVNENYEEVLKQIRNSARNEQPILLKILKTSNHPTEITLTPAVIQIHSVKAQLFKQDIAYIQISSFQDSTYLQVNSVLAQWQNKALKGIIIDLRNNPGGLLQQAIKVADLFIEKGTITSTTGRFSGAISEYNATPLSILNDLPMLILIDENTASAAEVLAGALQQNDRAIVMGQNSYGKNSIQSFIPTINQHTSIKLTVARYLTPNGENIHQKGISPDIKISLPTGKKTNNHTIIKAQQDDYALDRALVWIKEQS